MSAVQTDCKGRKEILLLLQEEQYSFSAMKTKKNDRISGKEGRDHLKHELTTGRERDTTVNSYR